LPPKRRLSKVRLPKARFEPWNERCEMDRCEKPPLDWPPPKAR
jgi:hypothetical protein